ncbi:hypothetical protein DITRI_Ditri10aG0024300 [Diplodiscus trichospermus]
MEEFSYNKQQKHRSYCVPLCGIFLTFVLIFWLFTHVGITVSNKPLPIFIFINFIVFALCFLSSLNQFQTLTSSTMTMWALIIDGGPDIGDSLPEEEEQVDKHIILVQKAVDQGIAAVSSDNSQSWERNHNQFELWRLERGKSKELLIKLRSEPPWKSMDGMSNEEFRFAVEAFIADKKEVMMQENIQTMKGTGTFSDHHLQSVFPL